ncbi:MAG: hypothetical protein M1821_002755 [Bathelium mastoideum]|nr:MAG: hypothetical protein M1821_002755 [Bathelium mastoideum]
MSGPRQKTLAGPPPGPPHKRRPRPDHYAPQPGGSHWCPNGDCWVCRQRQGGAGASGAGVEREEKKGVEEAEEEAEVKEEEEVVVVVER